MQIRIAIPNGAVDAKSLGAALEAATVANEGLDKRRLLPDIVSAIENKKIRWKAEDFKDGEHFDLGPVVLARGWGDCDDLAPWLCANLRAKGVECRPIAYQSAPNRWHAVVEVADGRILDPSVWAGMKAPTRGRDNPGVHGACFQPMCGAGQDALALIPNPYRGGWSARADTALEDGSHIASVGWDMDPETALTKAIMGYAGYHEGSVGEVCGEDSELGGFLSDVVSSVLPIASSVIPGGGMITDLIANAAKPLTSALSSAMAPGGHPPPVMPPTPRRRQPGSVPARAPMSQAQLPPLYGRSEGMVVFSPQGGGGTVVRF